MIQAADALTLRRPPGGVEVGKARPRPHEMPFETLGASDSAPTMPRPPSPRLLAAGLAALALVRAALSAEPLLDWSDWEKYRGTVQHPSGAFKAADFARARENIARHSWARSYATSLERQAKAALARLSPAYLAAMIPETTPGDPKFTPCPACRDRGKPVHPHGLWSWTESRPDQLTCDVCRTVFPHPDYPESIVLSTTWGKPQRLSFYGGEPFVIFGYKTGRPSFSGNIRARQVGHLASASRTLAEAFALTGNLDYARGVRSILLRFAAVYPNWLVHVGYGEYADLDPRIAAQFIQQLPAPELCPPPNQPDRKLHTGYWSAGRASGVGQESGFVRRMVEAYDFTCTAREADGRPLYSDAERRTIERDLLLEGTILLVCDKGINNKSVGNRTAAALVGLAVGHPGLVRFGWEGFEQTVSDWFLPDGTTSESPAYATMTLGNIWDLPQALRGYSEPEGYRDAQGRRRTATDLYHGTAYGRVWENMFRGLQGDLSYPAFADSYRHSTLSNLFTELMVANYPERPEYLALLREQCGTDLARAHAPVALYYREPGLGQQPASRLTLPDWVSADLRIGHLRSGADGRESLALLSASHWGGHHHLDSLNLTYWREGAEVLSDLGYLWDHPRKIQTTRTLAHNTVLLDERDQTTRERGGDVLFFRTTPHLKVMGASSRAYPQARTYERVGALVDHGGGRSYLVDFFHVQGGQRQDYVFHASAAACEILDATAARSTLALYDFSNVRAIGSSAPWRTQWQAGPRTCVAWNLPQAGETAFVGDGWGQRDWKNSDVGATLPYVVRRTEGGAPRTFASVFASHGGNQPFVRHVRRDSKTGALAVETELGTDYLLSEPGSASLEVPTTAGPSRLTGRFLATSVQGGRVVWTFTEPARP